MPLEDALLFTQNKNLKSCTNLNKRIENKLGNIVKEASMPEVRNLLSITVFSTKVMSGWLWTLRSSALIMDQVTLKNQSDKPSEPGARSFSVSIIAQPTATASSEKGTPRWCKLRRFSPIKSSGRARHH
jgi:hypothetical protein